LVAPPGVAGRGAVFHVVQQDQGGPPLPVGDAAELRAGGIDFDLDAVDVDGLAGPFGFAFQFLSKHFAQAPVGLELRLDVAKALLGLLERGRGDHDVAFTPKESGMDGKDEGLESGLCGAARGGDGEAARRTLFERAGPEGAGVKFEDLAVGVAKGEPGVAGEEVQREKLGVALTLFPHPLR